LKAGVESAESRIIASSIGETALTRLSTTRDGTVQSVFERAINIQLQGGLVSIVTEAAEMGPLNINLRLPGGSKFPASGLAVDAEVRVAGSTLKLPNGTTVEFGSARTYAPRGRLAYPLLTADKLEANLEAMRSTAIRCGNLAGLGELIGLMAPKTQVASFERLNLFSSAAVKRIVGMENALRARDTRAVSEAVGGIVGLGPGLTPSSDDMLAGLVLLCSVFAKNGGRVLGRGELVAALEDTPITGKTTTLSSEFLKQAAMGVGNEPVMSLCAALLTQGPASVETKTNRVLSAGETSGTDTVLGLCLGMRLCTGGSSGLELGSA